MKTLHEVEQELNIWGWPDDKWELVLGNTTLQFNPKTMIMTWVVMILVALFAIAATRNMSMRRPRGAQNVLELIFEGIRSLVNQNMDPKKGATILCVVVTYFIFILFSNLIGLVPTLSSPTADYNCTLGLALCTFFLIYFMGIKYKGLGYFKHYVQPFVFFLPINLLEDFSKPITLTFRLYGNIYGGEVLIAVLLGLLGGWTHVFGGFIASVLWLAFSIFVGFIQAFLFTMLSIAYFSMAVKEEH
ncbi:MAG TPA: F0F1 ATP synthase subunit A [Bacillota bacterium]|jgi:F-type H+-transporting ATPase subunit a|nr:F0F1 ATP synthase subunit A [Peptococcaceae bacterium MAG4]HPZ42716.1 F0F1 ATP synthase subunit A [Bacillota bacterium]HQD76239.1 F0F1 ATP synthase subunit A [Bacillota bacterium]HUM58782.1 F0F1 ATP synthase subunit A [Bacillota bacterium]